MINRKSIMGEETTVAKKVEGGETIKLEINKGEQNPQPQKKGCC